MTQAVSENSRPAPEPPPETAINRTLDPSGRAVAYGINKIYRPEEIANFRTVFLARHLIADEIERLIALLDELSGDDDLELNVGNGHDDPRLEDGEGVTVSIICQGSYVADEDAEPSLGSGQSLDQARWVEGGSGAADLEVDDCDDEPSLCGVTAGDAADDRDMEADLGTFDRMVDQTKSTRVRSGVEWPACAGELDSRPVS
ncbi:hypothetical protein JQ633_01580 [Bradyrhizobium tropiciagri]|uniref:hypothetical protein n=1 Tax=Bradyrhizobium tropiciagri TaxID=312253 RepID=UPI001BA9B9FB|nr:hypothetical protein [Bradyrhizobium tropiciagri]MBR0869032.1 hypothetical protein [Bradyrhizobium tropiciagri]